MKTFTVRIGSASALSLLALAGALLLLSVGGDASAAPARPDAIIHVATTGNDNPACGSVGSPCRTIQYALDRTGSGDEVRVAQGTYNDVHIRTAPPTYVGTTVVTQVVYINEPVTVRGGYNSDFSAWNPSAYPTTIDAQDQGRAAFISGDNTVTLEGLGFAYGNAAGMGGQLFNNDGGGGIYIMDATVVISGCQIVDNVAQSGGGISLWDYCNVTVQNSTIQGNQSVYSGGGIMQVTGDLFLYHTEILGNSTNTFGGGVATLYGTAVLVGNVIEGNVANTQDGGGFYLSNSVSTTLLYNNVIANNWAGARGDGLTLSQANAELFHNTIVGVGEGDGVAILNTSSITMVNSIIARNTVGVSADAGGSVWMDTTLWGSGWWNNTQETGGSGTIVHSGDFYGTPGFVNPAAGNYHILLGSIAKDRGVDAGLATDMDGEIRPMGYNFDIGADEYTVSGADPLRGLRVVEATVQAGTLHALLAWEPPITALTYTLRYDDNLITDANWGAATPLAVLPGSTDSYSASVPYSGGVVYFAIQYESIYGMTSSVSSNAIWPSIRLYMPLLGRN